MAHSKPFYFIFMILLFAPVLITASGWHDALNQAKKTLASTWQSENGPTNTIYYSLLSVETLTEWKKMDVQYLIARKAELQKEWDSFFAKYKQNYGDKFNASAVLEWLKTRSPSDRALLIAALILGVVAVPFALTVMLHAFGFGYAGIAVGSFAAKIQAAVYFSFPLLFPLFFSVSYN